MIPCSYARSTTKDAPAFLDHRQPAGGRRTLLLSADQVLTMDLHADQVHGFSARRSATTAVSSPIADHLPGISASACRHLNMVAVATGAGGCQRAPGRFSEQLRHPRWRSSTSAASASTAVKPRTGNQRSEGRDAVIFEMKSPAARSSPPSARPCAKPVRACITPAQCTRRAVRPAIERHFPARAPVESSWSQHGTVPEHKAPAKLTVLAIAPLLASAIEAHSQQQAWENCSEVS